MMSPNLFTGSPLLEACFWVRRTDQVGLSLAVKLVTSKGFVRSRTGGFAAASVRKILGPILYYSSFF